MTLKITTDMRNLLILSQVLNILKSTCKQHQVETEFTGNYSVCSALFVQSVDLRKVNLQGLQLMNMLLGNIIRLLSY